MAVKNNLPVTPSTATLTKMMQALVWGATGVKVFPIWAFGGLGYVKSILEPLPHLPIVVSGGATPEEVKEYLKLGVKGVCLSGTLWDQSIVSTGSISEVHEYAVNALSRI